MSHECVDFLEAVDVENDHSEWLFVLARLFYGFRKLVVERSQVRQAGERIGLSRLFRLSFNIA